MTEWLQTLMERQRLGNALGNLLSKRQEDIDTRNKLYCSLCRTYFYTTEDLPPLSVIHKYVNLGQGEPPPGAEAIHLHPITREEVVQVS